MKQRKTLSSIIQKEYLKSILYPLLLIETMLLAAYFWSNAFVNDVSQKTLIQETKINVAQISQKSASLLNNEFQSIEHLTYIFRSQHELFFRRYNPDSIDINKSHYHL
ncbi:MAG: hypothetical protein U9N49_04720, partial [Campylobacterota bacterium]|nr:hypothetical protein [Campylobacterota bacterium]